MLQICWKWTSNFTKCIWSLDPFYRRAYERTDRPTDLQEQQSRCHPCSRADNASRCRENRRRRPLLQRARWAGDDSRRTGVGRNPEHSASRTEYSRNRLLSSIWTFRQSRVQNFLVLYTVHLGLRKTSCHRRTSRTNFCIPRHRHSIQVLALKSQYNDHSRLGLKVGKSGSK
jgi:hypothetical protein